MATTQQPMTSTDVSGLARHWGLFVVSGAIGLIIGVLVLAYPDPSVKLLGVFLGIDLLIVGVLLIMRGASSDGEPGEGPGAILVGALGVIAGLLVIRNPGRTLELLVVAFAIYLVVAGAVALGQGLVHRERRWLTLGRGAVLVVAGTVLISVPDLGLKTLALIAGISLILQGLFEIAEGLALRRLGHATER